MYKKLMRLIAKVINISLAEFYATDLYYYSCTAHYKIFRITRVSFLGYIVHNYNKLKN